MSFRNATRASLLCAAGLALVLGNAARATAMAPLTTHVPQSVAQHQASLVGVPDPAQVLTLSVALPMRNLGELTDLVRALYNPASPAYGHYLSVPEFTARFGPTQHDYATAIRFLSSAGLQVTGVSANRYMVDLAGRVDDIERVFHLKLGMYRRAGQFRTFYAPDREPSLDLAVPVLHIVGLDNETPPTPRLRFGADASAGTGSGPGGNFIGSDIRAAYYGNGALTGAGQSVGLMELGPYNISDVDLYFHKVKQKLTVAVNGISTDGSKVSCTSACNDGEQALDIDYAISMAPGLDQVQVYVAHSPESVLNRMASDNTSKQLSTSWGWKNEFATDDPLLLEMAAQGQTFLTASGDASSLVKSEPWPEEDVNLTAVGGTDLTTQPKGGPWVGETGWSFSAGGPSVDKSIAIAPYQRPFINATNRGNKHLRNVPDVAGDANTNNFICAGGQCGGGAGGTSFASPIWAGFIALANQQAVAAGKPTIGFLNPKIYALAATSAYGNILHDQTSGVSGKFSAVAGYDLVTGLGSPQGQALIDALTQ